MTRSTFLLILIGAASALSYVAAFGLTDLRKNTLGFEIAFFAAFLLYLAACAIILRQPPNRSTTDHRLLITISFALLFRLTLLSSRPSLSDDMYRYVWDGRVQGHGLSPYRYPPTAVEVADLRRGDTTVWRYINRKEVVTVYPPGAQMVFAAIWRVIGDSVIGFKTAFVMAELIGGLLLIRLLQHFGQPPERVLIYLWSPLLVFEVAHAGHVDGLMLPFLVAAFWATVKERHWLTGVFLGAATMIKLLPAILLLALLPLPKTWEVSKDFRGLRPALKTLVAFFGIIAAGYAVYLVGDASPVGFLPTYLGENFNMGIARMLFNVALRLDVSGATLVNAITFGGLAVTGVGFVIKPAASHREALARCVWLIGWFTLLTQNLFAWYLLWLLPLIVLFVEPGKFFGFKLAPATAWLIFSGTITLSYLFFIRWRVVTWGQIAEFAPLYALLLASWIRQITPTLLPRLQRAPIAATID